MAMFRWVMTILAVVAAITLVFLLVTLGLFFLMSKLPVSQAMAPIMLAVLPVLMLGFVLVPLTAVMMLLFQRAIAYEVNHEGVVQYMGPMKYPTDWLMITKLTTKQTNGIEQWEFQVMKKDRPFVIFASFLADRDGFWQAMASQVPQEHPLRSVLNAVPPLDTMNTLPLRSS